MHMRGDDQEAIQHLQYVKITEVNGSTRKGCLQSSNFCLRVVGHEKLWMPIGVPCLQNLEGLFHCKNRIVNMTCRLSFWLQMSEPITHIDTDI